MALTCNHSGKQPQAGLGRGPTAGEAGKGAAGRTGAPASWSKQPESGVVALAGGARPDWPACKEAELCLLSSVLLLCQACWAACAAGNLLFMGLGRDERVEGAEHQAASKYVPSAHHTLTLSRSFRPGSLVFSGAAGEALGHQGSLCQL